MYYEHEGHSRVPSGLDLYGCINMYILPYTYECVSRSIRGIRVPGQAKPVADFYQNEYVNDLVFVLQERRNSNAMRLCRAGSQC